MAKSILKEVIIVLLIALAIILILGIFLYDYIPTNKVVPKIEQYQIPNSIKNELEEDITEMEETKEIIYEIDGTDLKNYEKSKDYVKGKVNPFSQEVVNKANTINTSNGTTPSTSNNSNTSSNDNNSNSVGNYLPNTGTK